MAADKLYLTVLFSSVSINFLQRLRYQGEHQLQSLGILGSDYQLFP